ncbi:RNA polymerase sigma-70 factor [Sphingobacterium alkalisoli]|uniref:RNA polymerase sigma-70 factor n=1 Tax=Sphingobacterium alkalisoli TaxID=1874115 RepID=A0A4U0H315_9SPHI|nr:RNA polymerase sigma-70 factor [Sphingobacterium alkalisoli]TJY65484.1 RNA polymerase sigma-70 factor [Sphingobacterium alkalisoli]GGH20182.1 DNA-directed RNA polymerase sigma-70 factor [Sphingobacterium alkalisoli]
MSQSPPANEKELLIDIANGSELAFSTLFDQYSAFVYSFGYKLMRSKESAQEIVQDIFLKIWVGRDKLISIENFGAYLNILVRNHCFNLLRKLAQQEKIYPELSGIYPNAESTTQNTVSYRETVKILDEILTALPAQQRDIYILCHFEGMKYEEVAKKMNISLHTVHYHMKLALKSIREHLIKRGISYQALLFFFICSQ